MAMHAPNGRAARAGAFASATQTITTTPTQDASQSTRPEQTSESFPIHIPASGTLRLRAEATSEPTQTHQPGPSAERRVQWAESVINNEGMGKKSSKVCCIYHKPREPGESSEEEDSSSDSDSGSDSSGGDDGAARSAQGRNRRARDHGHEHGGEGDCAAGHGHSHSHGKEKRRKNAYERQPKNT